MSPTVPTSARARAVTSSAIRDILAVVDRPGVLSLAGGLPAADLLDVEAVGTAVDAALGRRGRLGPTALQYGPTEGDGTLRDLLAARHGVAVDQVLVTSGAQQALDLVLRAVADPGDAVAVTDPGYLGAVQAASAAGLDVRPAASDDDGLDVDALATTLGRARRADRTDRASGAGSPVALHVVPTFHNPTGAVLADDRRRALGALADRHGMVVLEDDPYRDLWFDAAAADLAPIADHGELVVRIGSASKVLAPGLRVGWAVGPTPIIAAAVRLKQAADLHTGGLDQLVVAHLLADEAAHRAHLQRARRTYASRAGALRHALDEALGDRLALPPVRGGLFLWGRATDGTDTTALLSRAVAAGVAFVPGSAFAVGTGGGHDDRLRLSFASVAPDEAEEAAARLAAAWATSPESDPEASRRTNRPTSHGSVEPVGAGALGG